MMVGFSQAAYLLHDLTSSGHFGGFVHRRFVPTWFNNNHDLAIAALARAALN
jgi:hypothetical protein